MNECSVPGCGRGEAERYRLVKSYIYLCPGHFAERLLVDIQEMSVAVSRIKNRERTPQVFADFIDTLE